MEWLRKEIIRAGGFAAVAAATGISRPHLYSLCQPEGARSRRPLNPRLVAKLAPALPRIGQARWRDAVMRDVFKKETSKRTKSAPEARA